MKTGHFPEAHGLAYTGCTIDSIMVEGKDYGLGLFSAHPSCTAAHTNVKTPQTQSKCEIIFG